MFIASDQHNLGEFFVSLAGRVAVALHAPQPEENLGRERLSAAVEGRPRVAILVDNLQTRTQKRGLST